MPISPDEQLDVPGLDGTVRISIDRWGVAHIRAGTHADLFFAQGFNAARDRLWQMDLWRKRGLGLLAADFGPGFLAQDRAARLFLYRGDMAAEWRAYGPDAQAVCEAFVTGINAYVDLVGQEPHRLPPEFVHLGTRPATWRAEDVVRIRTHGWMRNALSEVLRANVLARGDADADAFRINLEPPTRPHVADRLDLGAIPIAVLDVYRLATAPVLFSDRRLHATLDEAWQWATVAPSGEVVRDARPHGSNNWAVNGSRTVTGRPILASDPHRLHAVPSLRYLVHLTAPGLDLIGAGEPTFPGITIGHNGEAAFGLTLFLGPDQEDVYVYDTKPDEPDAYRYRDAWEAMRVVDEEVPVKGATPQTVHLKFTRHGPVVAEMPHEHRAFAVRTVWSEPGTTPYGASLMAMRARNLSEFRDTMARWGAPPVNQVYADRRGEIAWVTAGLSPIRRQWDGLLPVPGDGRYEWDGFLDARVLPSLYNPPAGFVASANAMNLPADWSHSEHPIGCEWDDPSRARRLDETLRADASHSVPAACALQTDVVSMPARRLLPLLAPLVAESGPLSSAISWLTGWDARVDVASGPAALFEVWWSRHLKPALIARLVPDSQTRTLIGPGDIESLLHALEQPNPRLGTTRDALLISTLGDAFETCVGAMGPDIDTWSWGRLHQAYFEHGLAPAAAASPLLNVGPLPVGGSDATLMKGVYRPADFRVVMGASVRLVIDVGDWDRSVWINAPGQSGDPRSPHYADLAAAWAAGDYVPMLYTADAVDAATATCVILSPRPR